MARHSFPHDSNHHVDLKLKSELAEHVLDVDLVLVDYSGIISRFPAAKVWRSTYLLTD